MFLQDAVSILDAGIIRISAVKEFRQWRKSGKGTGWPAITQESDEMGISQMNPDEKTFV
jgi:hypothetical protein